MQVEIWDSVTGQFHQVEEDYDFFWWSEGNGSCDCNRAIFMGVDVGSSENTCLGCKRFIITAFKLSKPIEQQHDMNIGNMNSGYDFDLITASMVAKGAKIRKE
jgi:hypothetical protein